MKLYYTGKDPHDWWEPRAMPVTVTSITRTADGIVIEAETATGDTITAPQSQFEKPYPKCGAGRRGKG